MGSNGNRRLTDVLGMDIGRKWRGSTSQGWKLVEHGLDRRVRSGSLWEMSGIDAAGVDIAEQWMEWACHE